MVHEILELMRASQAILGSGHLAPQETRALVIAARSARLEKVLVTHPDSPSIAMPITLQQELALLGARFERCYLAAAPGVRAPILLEQMAAAIRTVGVHASLLSTDLGQAGLPSPVDGLRAFLSSLAGLGFSSSELYWMAGDHPAELLS